MTDAPRLHVDVLDGDGPPLFLVHGMLSSRRQWAPNLPALSRVARPVVFELWGHGRSPTPEDPDCYTAATYVAQLERVRRELGAPRIALCGQSYGAGIAMRYGLEHPDRTIAVVVTNSASLLSEPGVHAARRAADAERIDAHGHDALRSLPFHPRHALRLAPEVREALVEAAGLVDPRAVSRAMRHSLDGLSMVPDLERVSVPTLLVNGRQERRFQPLRDLAVARIPGCEVVDLEAGHAVNLGDPAGFDAAVSAFLARHRG